MTMTPWGRALFFGSVAVLFLCLLVVVSQAEGQVGSYDFVEANSDYISVANDSTLQYGTGDFTWAMWVKFAGTDEFEVIACEGTSSWTCSASSGDIAVRVARNASGQVGCFVDHDATGDWINVDGTSSLTGGQWYFVVCEADRSGNLAIYVDDMSTAEATASLSAYSAASMDPTKALEFGRRVNATPYHYDGAVAYAQVWKRVLSASEKRRAMRCPGSVKKSLSLNLLPHLSDLSGNGNNGTNNGADASADGPPIRRNCALSGGL